MALLYNLAKMTTATTGTGTITLGSAAPGYLTFAGAGVTNGQVVSYGIQDGTNSEVGTGTYTASGTTLTRTVINSTNSGSPINLSGNAFVYITALAADILNPTLTTNQTLAGKLTTVASATGGAGFNLPAGAAPSSPTNGDVWTTSAGIYVRINGSTVGPLIDATSVSSGAVKYLNTLTASNSASLADTTNITSTYTSYMFVFENVVPVTSSDELLVQVSTNGGSSYNNTGNFLRINTSSVATMTVDNTANFGVCATGYLVSPKNSNYKYFYASGSFRDSSGATNNVCVGRGYYSGATSVVNAVRFLFASGNISAGSIHIYGVQ